MLIAQFFKDKQHFPCNLSPQTAQPLRSPAGLCNTGANERNADDEYR